MRTAPALVVVGVALLALVGCVPDDDPVIPDPLPTSTPIFASDEEALAAAEEAYGAYLAVVDAIYADSALNSDALLEVATQEVLESEEPSILKAREAGHISTGTTMFDTMTLQFADLTGGSSEAVVGAYVCEDFSETDVVGPDGQSVVASDRQTRWPIVVILDSGPRASLLVSDVEDWTGDDFCAS
jgi:hypothetical protein